MSISNDIKVGNTGVQQGEHYSIESEKRSIIILKQLQNQGTEMRFLWRSSTNCLGAPYYFFDASCYSSTHPSKTIHISFF